MKLKLWEIVKLASENKLSKGDQFKALNIPIQLVIEYDGSELIYANIMGDVMSQETVTLCSGEINNEYEKISRTDYKIVEDMIYKICIKKNVTFKEGIEILQNRTDEILKSI